MSCACPKHCEAAGAARSPWIDADSINRACTSGVGIRYALTRWSDLGRFLHDGRIELDNSTVERAMRPIALGRKNRPFAGSGGAPRWATVGSLLFTAKLNIVERFAYLKDVLHRMSNGHPMNRLDHLCRQTPQPDPMCQEWTLTRIGTRCWR